MKNKRSEAIVNKALELFQENGIRSVKMDDIAHSVGISKRTLYETYSDKEELLLECIKLNSSKSNEKCRAFAQTTDSAMALIVFYIKQQIEEFSRYSPKFFIEAVRYKSVRTYLEQLRENEKTVRNRFILKGIRDGLFVSDLNYMLLERITHMAAENLINQKIYTEYSLQDIFETFILVFLRGILTEKGLQELNKYLLKE